ncbi:MAG: hypothetical protein JW888_10415 [Pirellulales bacterium]|nr:hypothetical protein [Pirellulales bacterium]
MKRLPVLIVAAMFCSLAAPFAARAATMPILYWTFGDTERAVDRSGMPDFSGTKYSSIDLAHPVSIGPLASAIESNGFAAYEDSTTSGSAYVSNYSRTHLDITETVSIFARINPGVADGRDDIFAARNRSQDSADPRYINIRYGFECNSGVPEFHLQGAGDSSSTTMSLGAALNPGTWYDLIGTFDKGVANFYVQESVSGTILGNITQTMPFTSLASADPVLERTEIHLLHNSWDTNGLNNGYQVEQVAVWDSLAAPSDILVNGITLPDPLPGPELPAVTPRGYWVFGNGGIDVADEGQASNLTISGLQPNTKMVVHAKRSNNLGIREGMLPGDTAGYGYISNINDGELDITDEVSIFARVNASAFDGVDDIARSNNGGNATTRKDQYALELVDGVPRFIATGSSISGGETAGIELGQAIETGMWYDITGVYAPTDTGGLMSITVRESETGTLLGIASCEVGFSTLWSNEDGGRMQLHVFETPGRVNGHQPGLALEQLAIWDRALTDGQIEALTIIPEPGIAAMLFGLLLVPAVLTRR